MTKLSAKFQKVLDQNNATMTKLIAKISALEDQMALVKQAAEASKSPRKPRAPKAEKKAPKAKAAQAKAPKAKKSKVDGRTKAGRAAKQEALAAKASASVKKSRRSVGRSDRALLKAEAEATIAGHEQDKLSRKLRS